MSTAGPTRVRRSLRTWINVALGGGLVLVVLFGIGSYRTIHALLEDARLERESEGAALLLERSVSQLKTAESWQRKYLITGDGPALRAYEGARQATQSALAEARLTVSNPDEAGQFSELESLVSQRLDNMDRVVTVFLQQGLAAASDLVKSEPNRDLRERLEGLVTRIAKAESAELLQTREQTQQRAAAVVQLIVAGGVLSLVLLVWAVYLVNRYGIHWKRAEQQLSNKMSELQCVSRALQDSEAQLRQVMDSVPVAIAYVDAQERLCFHNKAYEEHLGMGHDQLDGRTLQQILGPQLYQDVRGRVAEVLAGNRVTYTRAHRNAHGELREYEIKYIPRYGDAPEQDRVIGHYALGNDITEFKRIDRIKSEFVATVSHELRTPLTSIRGSLGLVGAGVAGAIPPQAKILVDIAIDNCERLVRLINDILDIEKLEYGQMRLELQPAKLAPLLAKAVAANLAFAAGHGVRLELQVQDFELGANLDPDRFTQVLTNLLSNAAKFSPEGSTVRIRLLQADARARVEVEDEGPGIAADFRHRIFGKFSQADSSDARQKGGTGLGLSISRAIMERMDGLLGYYDAPGGGTVFFLELPLAAGASDEAAAVSPTTALPS